MLPGWSPAWHPDMEEHSLGESIADPCWKPSSLLCIIEVQWLRTLNRVCSLEAPIQEDVTLFLQPNPLSHAPSTYRVFSKDFTVTSVSLWEAPRRYPGLSAIFSARKANSSLPALPSADIRQLWWRHQWPHLLTFITTYTASYCCLCRRCSSQLLSLNWLATLAFITSKIVEIIYFPDDIWTCLRVNLTPRTDCTSTGCRPFRHC